MAISPRCSSFKASSGFRRPQVCSTSTSGRSFPAAQCSSTCSPFPILAKWILIGRWKPRQIRIWSLAYLRFWIVKTLVQWNPIVLFTGSPLFSFYLRTLGAKVGRGVVIFSTHVPICTDLLTIGDGTVIQKDSFINGYRAHAGFIQVGAITIGKNAVISESTVIDIDTSMGDGTQLGRASSLHAGQAVPDGERWHGSPAQRTEVNYQSVEPTKCGALRRVGYTVMQLLNLLVVSLPLGISGLIVLLQWVPQLRVLLEPGTQGITTSAFYVHALVVSLVLFFGGLIFALLLRDDCPSHTQPRHHTGQGLSAVRVPLRAASSDRTHDQSEGAHLPLR